MDKGSEGHMQRAALFIAVAYPDLRSVTLSTSSIGGSPGRAANNDKVITKLSVTS